MCSASRAVIYTGLHQPHNGIFDNAGVPYMKSLDRRLPTIGKILRKLGYYTAYKGKWHLNGAMAMEDHPDHIKALFESTMDKDYGFYDYTGTGDYIEGALGGYQYDAVVGAQALQWLKAKGRPMTDRKQPWYLAVNFVNPHDVMWVDTDRPGEKVQATDAQLGIAFPAGRALPAGVERGSAAGQLAAAARRAGPRACPSALSRRQRLPDRADPERGMARPLEAELLLQCHPRRRPAARSDPRPARPVGLADKTIIVFTSDHGELLGSHGGLSGKGTTAYRQQNQVPLLIVHPEIKGGQRCGELTSHIDFVPTIVAMTGKSTAPVAETLSQMKGRDIGPLLRQPVNPDFTRARGACCSATASSWSTIPASRSSCTRRCATNRSSGRTSSRRSNCFRSIGRSGCRFARSRTNATASRAISRSGASTRRARSTSCAPERSRAVRPAGRSRRGGQPRLRLRPQSRSDRPHERQAECTDRGRNRRRRWQLPAFYGFHRLGSGCKSRLKSLARRSMAGAATDGS